MLITVLLLLLLIPIWVVGVATVTYHADISTDFYKKFIKTVYMEEMNYFEVEQTKKTRRYIIRSNGPIEFEKYKYYWNDTLLESKRSLNLCEYRISWMIDSKELDETYNADGVKMKSLFYYCHFAQSCMGLECRIDSRLLVPPIFLTVFVTIFWLFKRMLWRDMKRTERIQRENRTAENPATIERIELEAPPSYNSVFSKVPPSYESVTLGKVT